MRRFYFFATCFLAILWLSSCDRDFFESEGIGKSTWTPEVAVPVGYVEYSLAELISEIDTLVAIETSNNDLITLVYEQSLLSESAESFLGNLDQVLFTHYDLVIPPPFPDPVVLPNTSFSVEEILEIPFDAGENGSIDSILFNSGILDIVLNSSIKADIDAELVFTSLLMNGEPFAVPLDLTNNGAATITRNLSYPMNDFKVDLSNGSFQVLLKMDITTYGAPVSSSDYIDFEFDLGDLSFEAFFGNVGNRTINIEDERFTFDFFNEFVNGEIFFADPRLIFKIENSFGLPVSIDLDGIYAEDPQDGVIDLTGTIVETPQLIEAPGIDAVGEAVTSVIRIDKETSNFNELASALPTSLNMPLNGTTNPNGETSNFVTKDSRININLRAELPLDLRVLNLGNDVILDFSLEEIDYMTEAVLRVNTENGFPLRGNVQVTFSDENGDLLSLAPYDDFETPLFEAAPVDSEGFVTEPAISNIEIALSRNDLNLIKKSTEARIEVLVNTTDANEGQTVKLLSNYKIKVNIGVRSSFELDLEEN